MAISKPLLSGLLCLIAFVVIALDATAQNDISIKGIKETKTQSVRLMDIHLEKDGAFKISTNKADRYLFLSDSTSGRPKIVDADDDLSIDTSLYNTHEYKLAGAIVEIESDRIAGGEVRVDDLEAVFSSERDVLSKLDISGSRLESFSLKDDFIANLNLLGDSLPNFHYNNTVTKSLNFALCTIGDMRIDFSDQPDTLGFYALSLYPRIEALDLTAFFNPTGKRSK